MGTSERFDRPFAGCSGIGNFCLGLFDTCPCDATVPRVAQT